VNGTVEIGAELASSDKAQHPTRTDRAGDRSMIERATSSSAIVTAV
jgi:hypothetical protein